MTSDHGMSDTKPTRATVTEFEAAQYLGLSSAYLSASRLTPPRTDGPPFVRLGRAVRYRLADLDAYLEARRVETRRTR